MVKKRWQVNLNFKSSKKVLIILSVFIILLWVAPYFILGENAHLQVLDNMDSNFAWYKILKTSGKMYAPLNANIPQIINGELSRNALYSQFYGIVNLFYLFPPMTAYGLSQLLTRIGAFVGMYLLLQDYIFKKENINEWISIGVALTFALTPFWPSGMLSTLGMPLALWAFLNIRAGKRSWKNALTLTILPLYSTFILGFFYFLSAMGIFWFVDSLIKKRPQWRWFFSIVYMSVLYLGIEYRVVASLLLNHQPTNRSVFLESTHRLCSTIRIAFENYILGHYQAQGVFSPVILIVSYIALWTVLKERTWKQERVFLMLHLLNFLLSVWYAFWFYKGWGPLKTHISVLTTFNFSRYHYLHPMVDYILFALSLRILTCRGSRLKKLAFVCIFAQLIVLIPFNEQIADHSEPTYKQFFSVEEFKKIKDYIGMPQRSYRVVSIGLHPDIAQYNGFYTLDTYNNFYPLSYKEEFRKIIVSELNKSRTLRNYFDHWGGRCYIFAAELGKHYMYSKDSTKVIKHLDLNTKQLKAMGGQYIFSALPIKSPRHDHLIFKKSFTDPSAYWKIYLYEVE